MKSRYVGRIQLLVILVVILTASFTALHAQTFNVLYNFGTQTCDPLNPSNPGIISQGRDGNLYSTAAVGGCPAGGAAFKITPKGKLTLLHSFGSQTGDAGGPFSGLTLGTDGTFWGTSEGGPFLGNIFKVTASGKVTDFNVLGGTNNVNGDAPFAPAVQGMDGNFYGTTGAGGDITHCTYGNGGCGVIYKITPSGKYQVIHTFKQINDGGNPLGPLALSTDGNFYGTTSAGGAVGKNFKNGGVVFKLTPAGKYSVLYTFCSQANCADGYAPFDGLVQGTDGNFYGTTSAGGTGNPSEGVVFKITPTGRYTVLYSFCAVTSCKDGSIPYGGVVQATDGNIYGTTLAGGSKNLGVIFQLTRGGKYTVLYSFDSTTGAYPKSALVQNTNGIVYGTTNRGGAHNRGVFFSVDMKFKPFVSMVAPYGKVGQTIEILGQGLTGTTAVSFNGTPATIFTVVSDNYLTAVVPSGTTAGLVTVTTPGGTLTSNRQFRVIPFILNFSPTSGKVTDPVTINGTSFTGATQLTFGGVKATFTLVSDVKITTKVPTGAKTGRIQVTTPGGTATSATDFLVTPRITSFNPTSGKVGTVVTITGVSLIQATKVTFGGVAATKFTVNSDTQVTATVPTGGKTGKIVITTPGGTATSATDFTVTP